MHPSTPMVTTTPLLGAPLCSPRQTSHSFGCSEVTGGFRILKHDVASGAPDSPYVFGIDGLQGMHLAIKCAGAGGPENPEARTGAGREREDDLGMPSSFR